MAAPTKAYRRYTWSNLTLIIALVPIAAACAQAVEVHPKLAEVRSLIDQLPLIEPGPSINHKEHTYPFEIIKQKPIIDVEIYFNHNSTKVGRRALSLLERVANVLSTEQFKGTV